MKTFAKVSLFIFLLIVLGLASGHITFKLLSLSRTAEVPDLRGKNIIEANTILRGKNLYIRLEGEDYDSHVPQGCIIRQDVPPRNKIKEGREVRIILSKGPRVQYVPDVVGQPLERAEALLRESGIRVNKIVYVHSDKVAKNTIIAQRPEMNEKGADTFTVVVSLGGYVDRAPSTPSEDSIHI